MWDSLWRWTRGRKGRLLQSSAQHALQLRCARYRVCEAVGRERLQKLSTAAQLPASRRRDSIRSDIRGARYLCHRSSLRRRGEVRGDPGLLHRMAAQEPTARVRGLGVGQPAEPGDPGGRRSVPPQHGGRVPPHGRADARQRHPGHHVHPPVGRNLGGHGEHRVGVGPAGDRRVVRGHRDRQRAARGQPRQGHRAAGGPQAPRAAQDRPRGPGLGDPGGGRGAGADPHRPQPAGQGALSRREPVRGRGRADGRLRGRAAGAHALRDHRRPRHGDRGAAPARPRARPPSWTT